MLSDCLITFVVIIDKYLISLGAADQLANGATRETRNSRRLISAGRPPELGDWPRADQHSVGESLQSVRGASLVAYARMLFRLLIHAGLGKPMYTFRHYLRRRWERDAGLRLDHLLVSPNPSNTLVAEGCRSQRSREEPATTLRHGLKGAFRQRSILACLVVRRNTRTSALRAQPELTPCRSLSQPWANSRPRVELSQGQLNPLLVRRS